MERFRMLDRNLHLFAELTTIAAVVNNLDIVLAKIEGHVE
jgi:hypothetical protein